MLARLKSTTITLLALSIGALSPAGAGAAELPETAAEAMAYYEDGLDDWLDGPVQYLILESEKKAFESLTDLEEKEAFKREFWERRDHDLRDQENPFKDAFYERVAYANRRFNELPAGWKSDRGMIHVMLGKADYIRRNGVSRQDVRVWTYRTVGPGGDDMPFDSDYGEIRIAFAKLNHRSRWQIAGGFAGLGAYPTYVLEVLDLVRVAAVDPAMARGSMR